VFDVLRARQGGGSFYFLAPAAAARVQSHLALFLAARVLYCVRREATAFPILTTTFTQLAQT
jgi:hypothetical protein